MTSSPSPSVSLLGRAVGWLRRPLANAFGVTHESRESLVKHMLERQVQGAAMYWLQLVLAMAIATLGLALGSSTVVIGAMLISPLMAPIVELGVGLAVGSSVLVLRSFARIALSVAIVVTSAAVITLALPFHEVTGPISARAAPTALDLLIAICCALMASFTTLTARSPVATTAAGTAVAIALVPPLCVVGFGLGTDHADLARGAALLFTASFSAIMLFAVLTFSALGFGALDVAALERSALPEGTVRSAALARVQRLLGGWSGRFFRIVLPLLLLALVYVPLRRALEEVAWEVRVRQAVRRELDAISRDVVRSTVDVAPQSVRVELVVVGSQDRARMLERRIGARVTRAIGIAPTVEALAVPDVESMRKALAAIDKPKSEILEPPPALPTALMRVNAALAKSWPASSAGALVAWRLDAGSRGATAVELVHFGDALGRTASDILERDLSDAAQEPVRVDDVVLPHEPLSAPANEGVAWLTRVAPLLERVAHFDTLYACVGVPEIQGSDGGIAGDGGSANVREAVVAAAKAIPDERARVRRDVMWSVRVQTSPCADESMQDQTDDGGATTMDAAPPGTRLAPEDGSAITAVDSGATPQDHDR